MGCVRAEIHVREIKSLSQKCLAFRAVEEISEGVVGQFPSNVTENRRFAGNFNPNKANLKTAKLSVNAWFIGY